MSALDGPGQSPEAGPLAREMAASVREMVESYLNAYGMSREEASAKAREPAHPDFLATALSKPPDEVSWFELENLLERDPERALRRWEEIEQAAREEAGSGHRGAKAVERWGGCPWQLAQFLALRQELLDGWQPRDGIERQLLETMAQAQTAVEYWLGVLMARSALQDAAEQATLKSKGRWEPPRLSGSQAVEQAGAMVDRFNRIFLRTLQGLRALRQGPRPVAVRNATQVNVGQQQVNLAGGEPWGSLLAAWRATAGRPIPPAVQPPDPQSGKPRA